MALGSDGEARSRVRKTRGGEDRRVTKKCRREDRRRRRGRRRLSGGGCLPPLNPLVLALNMIQMLSSLLFRSPGSHPTATAHEPRASHPDPSFSLTVSLPVSSHSLFVLRFRATPNSLPFLSLPPRRTAASSADLFPRLTRG